MKLQFAEDYCMHVKRHLSRNANERSIQFCCPACESTGKRISFTGVGRLATHFKQIHQKYLKPVILPDSVKAPKKIRIDDNNSKDAVSSCLKDSSEITLESHISIMQADISDFPDSGTSHQAPASQTDMSRQSSMFFISSNPRTFRWPIHISISYLVFEVVLGSSTV